MQKKIKIKKKYYFYIIFLKKILIYIINLFRFLLINKSNISNIKIIYISKSNIKINIEIISLFHYLII